MKLYKDCTPEEKQQRLLQSTIALLVLAIVGIPAVTASLIKGFVSTFQAVESAAYEEPSDEIEQVVENHNCSVLATAEKFIADYEAKLLETYTTDYFESEFHLAFVEGYWSSFWLQHQYCRSCMEANRVPTEYLQ